MKTDEKIGYLSFFFLIALSCCAPCDAMTKKSAADVCPYAEMKKAIEDKDPEKLHWLVDAYSKQHRSEFLSPNLVAFLAAKNRLDLIQLLLEKLPEYFDEQLKDAEYILYFAYDNPKLIQFLIAYGAPITTPNFYHCDGTMLHFYAGYRCWKSVRCLIENGGYAYLKTVDASGYLPLKWAQQRYDADDTRGPVMKYMRFAIGLCEVVKKKMEFGIFAESYLDQKDLAEVAQNWKNAVRLAESLKAKDLLRRLYIWGIKEHQVLQKGQETPLSKLSQAVSTTIPAYLTFFLLDTMLRTAQIEQLAKSLKPESAKETVENIVGRYKELASTKEQSLLQSTYLTLLQKKYNCDVIQAPSLSKRERKICDKLGVVVSYASALPLLNYGDLGGEILKNPRVDEFE
ncbi:MAG: hypothetical protein M1549_03920 [Candidatus Dependentiae bacterium]|nr:hypothetical protein [Candidatus Dependentiae bacterium]